MSDPTVLGLLDRDGQVLKVHLLPLEVEQLVLPHAGVDGDDQQRLKMENSSLDYLLLLILGQYPHHLFFNPVHGHFLDGIFIVWLSKKSIRTPNAQDSGPISISSSKEIKELRLMAVLPMTPILLFRSGSDSA